MLFDWILNALLAIVEPVLNALPTTTLTFPALTGFMAMLAHWDTFLPIHEITYFVIVYIAATIPMLAFSLAIGVYKLIPLKAT